MTAILRRFLGSAGISFLVVATFAQHTDAAPHTRKIMAPMSVRFEVPALQSWVELSAPAYPAATVEDTPYQLLQLCRHSGACATLRDVRGMGGLSISANRKRAFSPDRLYLVVLRMTAVDASAKGYGRHYYEIYDLRELALVAFRTPGNSNDMTDRLLGWSPQHPHALEVSVGPKKIELAYPVGE